MFFLLVNPPVELKSSSVQNCHLANVTSSPHWAPPSPLSDNWQEGKTQSPAPMLLKWLESAARFRPRQVCWGPPLSWSCSTPINRKPKNRVGSGRRRHREELDAAEALAFLSRSSRGQSVWLVNWKSSCYQPKSPKPRLNLDLISWIYTNVDFIVHRHPDVNHCVAGWALPIMCVTLPLVVCS